MFGEYMVYCNKPIILICNDTAFVRVLPETIAILGDAKPRYVLDVDNQEQIQRIAKILEQIIPLPKEKAVK